jgi:hypothetical protein
MLVDDRIAKLDTAKKALNLAENARRLGDLALADAAMQRATELRANGEGFTSPAELAIATALYAYEEERSRLQGSTFRAGHTRKAIANHGPLMAAERIVLKRQRSKGFEVLEEAGLARLSFEAIVLRFPEEFSEQARDAARARLEGRAPPLPAKQAPPVMEKTQAGTSEGRGVVLDAEAIEFLEAFSHPPAWFLEQWLPRYERTVSVVADALEEQRPEDLFHIIWKHADNSVSHAGLGLLKYETIDNLRGELIQVIRDIHEDGSPEGFQAILHRFATWKEQGHITKVPRLLVARAFAAIHPSQYHTTVDVGHQNKVLKWFAQHTGFVMATAGDWASRARALTTHLDGIDQLREDVLRRNIFPWFVIDRLSAKTPLSEVPPGHSPRPLAALADLSSEQRRIKLRHNALQTALFTHLESEYGENMVWTEYRLRDGCAADAIVRLPHRGCYLYEIKIADTATLVIRQAMGQLLEYGFREEGLEPEKLFVVGEPALDAVSQRFIERLRRDFNLAIDYLQIALSAEDERSLEYN